MRVRVRVRVMVRGLLSTHDRAIDALSALGREALDDVGVLVRVRVS